MDRCYSHNGLYQENNVITTPTPAHTRPWRTVNWGPESGPTSPTESERTVVNPRPKLSPRRSTGSATETRRERIHRELSKMNIGTQRGIFWTIVFLLNSGCLLAALLATNSRWVFTFFLFVKSKDCLSAMISLVAVCGRAAYDRIWPKRQSAPQWILNLIPAYSETEEEIFSCLESMVNNKTEPHKQVFCIILDGQPRDMTRYLTRTITTFDCPHVSFKGKPNTLDVVAGFYGKAPVLIVQKRKNMGKKDSLILCFDLFNYARASLPKCTQLIKDRLYDSVLPELTHQPDFEGFDMIFCTDADSALNEGAIKKLADAISHAPNAIASCGIVLVKNRQYTFWKIFQHYQYAFGQIVRRRAESFWGRVTCLPGCVTMIAVRPECGPAIEHYARPVECIPVLRHQVQYLGTDRRLTYCLLKQGTHLKTIFVQDAVSETAPPESLKHYLSQRRRWGSNAYFNNYFYLFGPNMALWTRYVALVELLRMTLVYYRVANTGMLIYNIVLEVKAGTFSALALAALLVVSQFPTVMFAGSVTISKHLRPHLLQFFLGFFANKCAAFPLSLAVFTNVAMNLGSHSWGMTGLTPKVARPADSPV